MTDALTTQPRLDETAVLELENALRGELLRPGDSSYEEHRRIWNGNVGRASPVNSGHAIDVILRQGVEIAHP